MKPSRQRCGDCARCRGSRRRSRKSTCRIQGPGALHSPCFEIRRKIGDTADVLGDEKTWCWFDEVVGIAVGGIFDTVILELTQKLQTFVEFKAMTENLSDLEVVDIDGEGNARTTLRIRRFTGIEFELRSVKIRMGLFLAKVEFKRRSSLVVPSDFVRSNPRVKELPSWLVVLGDDVRLTENIVTDIDEIRFRRVDSATVGVLGLFCLCCNNGIVRFEMVEHARFDKIHGCGRGVVIKNRREDTREISVDDFKGGFVGGGTDSGVDRKFDGGDILCPVRAIAIDVVAKSLENRAVGALRLTVRLRVVSSRHEQIRAEEFLHRRPEIASKLRIPIGNNGLGKTMETIDVVVVEPSYLLSSDILRGGNKVSHFRECANDDEEGVIFVASIVLRGWEVHEIHRNNRPRALCCGKRLGQAKSIGRGSFRDLTVMTTTNAVNDIRDERSPVEVTVDRGNSLLVAEVTKGLVDVIDEDVADPF